MGAWGSLFSVMALRAAAAGMLFWGGERLWGLG